MEVFMRTGTLALTTKDGTQHRLEMFLFSWVNSASTATEQRWVIEIAVKNDAIGQRLFHITTSGAAESQAALSAFHGKLLAALASFLEVQITAYTTEDVLPPHVVEVDLDQNRVYLIVS
jgi:hypothetical protein